MLGASLTATSSILFTNAVTFDASISISAAGVGGIVFTSSTMVPATSEAYSLTLSALGGSITALQLGSPSAYISVLTLTAKALNVSSIYTSEIIENGSETISSDITAPGAYILFSDPTTVAVGTFIIDVTGGTAPGSITFASTLDSTSIGTGSLTFKVGGGNLTFDGAVGGIYALGDVLIDTAQNVMVEGAFTGSSFTQLEGGGTTTIAGTMTTSSSTGISLTGTIMDITAPLITDSSGPIAFVNAGLLTVSGSINSNGPVAQSGGGKVALGSTILATNTSVSSASVSFTNPITLTGDVVINTDEGGGDITFGSLATIDGLYNLSLIAGAGEIVLDGEVGGLTPLSAVTVYSADDLTLPALTCSSLTQLAGTGTTTLGGAVTATGSGGVVIVTNILDIDASVETLGKGPIILQNSGLLTISSGAAIEASGIFLQTGTGDANLSGTITGH